MAYYSDINLELKKTTSGDIEEQINAEAIKNSLGNILSTIQGSRRMLPQFALNSNNVLFDQMDEITAYELGDRVLEAIRIWDNRIEVEQIKVQPKYDLQQYNILISFSIRGIRESQEFDFILRKI